MSSIDWTLIIGYPLHEAVEYLREEQQDYRVIMTAPPKKRDAVPEDAEDSVRIIGIRSVSDCLELICAACDWSVR
ncbi:MAG: hypothetical protein ACE3NC_08310 [Candidatus Wallacebacter cryptica]|nr:hypothetical protein [Bacillota bacterium]